MSNKVLTKKDLNKAFFRQFTCAQICFNYETMQSGAVVYVLGPCLEKISEGDPERLKKRLKTHFQFFNTQPWVGGLIMGSVLAIEEDGAENSSETAAAIKTSLMGPFAGLGDSIFFVLPKTIFGAIAAYMALEGSPVGVFICLALGIAMIFVRSLMFHTGYSQGVRFITNSQSILNNITEAASVMGLVVIGALIASTVKLKIPLTFTIGEATSNVQSIFDSIMPNFLPLMATIGIYFALGRKKMTSTKMIWIIMAISVLGVLIGLLG